MKVAFSGKQTLLTLAGIFSLAVLNSKVEASPYVSNLGNVWTNGGIGDIHALFPRGTPNGTDTAHFTTGAGNLLLNGVTFEFEYSSSYPAGNSAQQWVNIQLFKQSGTSSILVSSFGNPVQFSNSTPTQWLQSSNPGSYTAFIDFSSIGQINLNPFSQYSVVLSDPANSPADVALMFAKSSAYTSAAGWTMSATTSGNSYASVVSHKRLELFSLVFPHSGAGATGLDPLQCLFAPA